MIAGLFVSCLIYWRRCGFGDHACWHSDSRCVLCCYGRRSGGRLFGRQHPNFRIARLRVFSIVRRWWWRMGGAVLAADVDGLGTLDYGADLLFALTRTLGTQGFTAQPLKGGVHRVPGKLPLLVFLFTVICVVLLFFILTVIVVPGWRTLGSGSGLRLCLCHARGWGER